MKNLIKKILKEEFEDDFGWAKEVTPFEPGKKFDEDDICFDSGTDCLVNIDKDNITFSLDWDWWVGTTDLVDENSWYVEPLLFNPDTDGGGDYYDVDSDEFNYSGYRVSDDQKERFQQILNITDGEVNILNIIRDDDMSSLYEYLKYEPLQRYFENLESEYLNLLGYAIQKNRWLSLGSEMKSQIKNTGAEWDLDRDRYGNKELTITVPMNVVWDWYSKGIDNLTDLLLKISDPISNNNWYDWFYEDWDTGGYEDEISDLFNIFLYNAEQFLENDEEFSEYKKVHTMLDELGFIPSSLSWERNIFKRPNPNNTVWEIKLNHKNKKATLVLYDASENRWGASPKREFEVPFEDTPKYVNNYSLKL